MMKSRSGERPERFVHGLEQLGAQSGCKVARNVERKDVHTSSSREIDVLITMPDDSVVVIECRDRVRPQDVTWIEQIYGKVQGIQPARTIAVSTSGFTEPAKVKAAAPGIQTRELNAVDRTDLVAWFQC